jgi:quercetin 2,3-dioxygenase
MDRAPATDAPSAVLQVVELGSPPWPTIDPFLFCVHHVDAYPAGNGRNGPAASLAGRSMGNDFAGVDGWRMYHGQDVPGFPQHPHRGFETVTYVREGFVDHADSIGARARYGRGDVQWLTAGSGVVHSETFPLLDPDGPNPMELFQIWVNLAAADKTAAPYFTMLWDGAIPRWRVGGSDGVPGAEVTVIAGELAGLVPPPPPPRSWASRPDADVAIWHVRLEPGAAVTLPAARHPDTVRTLYAFAGGAWAIDGQRIDVGHAAVVASGRAIELTSPDGVEVLVLQGRPIGEPVAQYGPFVMNDRAGVEQAFADYRETQFGGWPWTSDEPVHDPDDKAERFVRWADGTVDRPPT